MAWEALIVNHDGSPLGLQNGVREAIGLAFPDTVWRLDPGGQELLDELQRYGTALSDEWRAKILQTPPHWHGLFDTKALSIDFHFTPGDSVRSVAVTTRGDHAAAEQKLRALAADRGWSLEDDRPG